MKKVLSFVLVLALVLSSFSMAFAGETVTNNYTQLTDIDGIANEEAVEVCNNLGIVTGNPDGTFQPEKTVNRAEFAAMITRALGIPESALAGYTATNFKDTNGYGWAVPYLAFCESKGIMLGDGAGNAMPGRTINTNEAVTMVLRAIGYTANSAQLVGVWPANYVTKAQDLGIYDDVTAVGTVDKANAAQMIYNALTVQKVQVNSDGETKGLFDGPEVNGIEINMLNSGLNCYQDKDNGIAAEEYRYAVRYEDDAVINVMPHVGEYAKVYRNKDDKIVAIADVDSTKLVGTFETANDANGHFSATTFFCNDDIDYNVNDLTAGAFFINNDPVDKGTFGVGIADGNPGDIYTINAKVSGKNITGIYSIMAYTIDASAKVKAGDLEDINSIQKLLGFEFDTDKNDNIKENTFELVGAKSLSDIKADDVVYVYHNQKNSKLVTRVEVGTEVVEGTVSKTNSDATKITVNGKTYEYSVERLAGDLANASASKRIEAGDSVKLYLDGQGFIYKYDITAGKADNYAVVINAGINNANSTMDDNDVQFKLITADGAVKTYVTDIDDLADTNLNASLAGMNVTVGSIIKYSLNKDGELDDIESAATATDWYVVSEPGVKYDVSKDGYYNGREINEDAVIFTVDVSSAAFATLGITATYDGAKDKDNYDVTTLEKLKGTDDVYAFYVLDEDGNIECMVINADATADKDSYGVVIDKYISTDADGDKVYMVTALVNGQAVEYTVKNEDTWQNSFNKQSFYRFTTNSSNELDGAGGTIGVAGTSNGAFSDKSLITNKITVTSDSSLTVNGKVVTIDLDGNKGTTNDIYRVTLANGYVTYSYDAKDAEFAAKSFNSMKNDITGITASKSRELVFFAPDKEDMSAPSIAILFPEH